MPLQGTFSQSLLNCPIWAVLGPGLMASGAQLQGTPGPSLTPLQDLSRPGCESQNHDFSFCLASGLNLHFLLLTPSSLELSNKQETVSRLRRFSTTSPASSQSAIAILLSEDPFTTASGKYNVDGLLALQVLIVESLTVSIPIIPIPDVSCFLSCVEEYMTSFVDLPLATPSLADSVSLLLHTTASVGPQQSLSEHDTNILGDLFPSLRALSQGVRSPEGQAVLRDYLGDEVALGLVEFWDRDWRFE